MISPFFTLAAVSADRQRAFRALAAGHLLLMAGALAVLGQNTGLPRALVMGNLLLVAGIVQGALLIGWRLAQLPKSQALEFLLVSPLQPAQVLLGEALVGLTRLALVTLAGLPVLLLMVLDGLVVAADVPVLLAVPFTCGAVTGLLLACWAYEPLAVRRWGERLVLAGIVLYLAIGILAGENLRRWLACLPGDLAGWMLALFWGFHQYNPFGIMKYAMENEPELARPRVLALEMAGTLAAGLLLLRAACRLKGHFQDRHYRPQFEEAASKRGAIGDRPLSWWAVRRVTEYSGRINLWLAGGFGILYALYTLAGPNWPAGLGRGVFDMFEQMGGIPVLATALMLLAAVPAAFQYGLWDSNAQDRCRRLELLLLTGLDGRDYWAAATAAAWRRGRGYFAIAVLLLLAGQLSNQMTLAQTALALAAGVILWGLYFAIGFHAFARGAQANGLGLLLSVGLPVLAIVLFRSDRPQLANLLPPATVYASLKGSSSIFAGSILAALAALGLTRWGLARCEQELRCWYARHHGKKVME